MRIQKIVPYPRNKNQNCSKFTPLGLGKAKPFFGLPLSWFNFLFWLGFALLVRGVCGGFLVAAFFRSRGWN